MATLSEMRSRIADDLERSDLSSQINEAINRAIDNYQKEQFWFMEAITTFTTVADQENYDDTDGVPTDIGSIDLLELTTDSGNKVAIKPSSYGRIRALNGSSPSGDPLEYDYYNNDIWFYPIPDSANTITISYKKTYSDLSGDSDSNDFTTHAEDLIEARARWWLNMRIIKDEKEALEAKQEELEALQSLRERSELLLSDNKITPTVF